MTAAAHELWDGLRALVCLARESDAAKTKRYEQRLADVAQRAWARVWPTAEKRIVAVAAKPNPTEADLEAALDAAGQLLAPLPTTEQDEADNAAVNVDSYTLGRGMALDTAQVGRAKAADLLGKELTDDVFTVRDEQAINWLTADSMFWIRDAWDQALGDRISAHAREAFGKGERRGELAKELKAAMAQFQEPDSYWDVVASAAIVRARSMGSVSGLNAAGARSFKFVAVMDERTSDQCREMNGRVFTMQQANAHVDNVTQAATPDQHKEAWPWPKTDQIAGQSNADLAAAGIIMPPVHGRCRSRIVVEDFVPFSELVQPGPPVDPGAQVAQPMEGSLQLGAGDVRPTQGIEAADTNTGKPFAPRELAGALDKAYAGLKERQRIRERLKAMKERGDPAAAWRLEDEVSAEHGDLWWNLPPDEAEPVMRELHSLVSHYGLEPRTDQGPQWRPLNLGQRSDDDPGEASANALIGGIEIKPKTARRAAAALRKDVLTDRDAWDVHVLTHEIVHQHGAAVTHIGGTWASAGRQLEEATTELAARRIVADRFAPDAEAAERWIRMGYGDRKAYQRITNDLGWAYVEASERQGLVDLRHSSAQEKMADAAIRFRRRMDDPPTGFEDSAARYADLVDVPEGMDKERFRRDVVKSLQGSWRADDD